MNLGLLLLCINMIHQMLVYQFDTHPMMPENGGGFSEIFTGGII